MLIIQNSAGGGTNLINSGKKNFDKQPDGSNSDVDLYNLLGNEDFPVGTIMLFNGDIKLVKPPWYFCDGSHGTPPLENKFIRCVNNPSDSNKGLTGGTADASIPNHTHTIKMTSAGGHKHSFVKKTYTTKSAGSHSHTQYHSPKWGGRTVCAACGPTKYGSHKINSGMWTDSKHLTSSAGTHTHTLNLVTTTTGKTGAHNHNYVYLSSGSGDGKGKNIPKHTKMYHIMKVR